MRYRCLPLTIAAMVVAILSGCDRDRSTAPLDFRLSTCPAGPLGVNAPITLAFTAPVSPAAVVGANIVVSNALTGVEFPGALSLQSNGSNVVFTPSAPLPFQTPIRIRIQNLIAQQNSIPLPLTVCEAATAAAPITQLFWNQLPLVSGNRLSGGAMYAPDSGYVAVSTVPIVRRTPGGWEVVFDQPYFQSSFDVAFTSRNRGFSSHLDTRAFRGVILGTSDAATTFDTLFSIPGETVNRLLVRPTTASDSVSFGVAGGGSAILARLLKYTPSNGTFASVATFSNTGFTSDVSFAADTTLGAAVSSGTLFSNNSLFPGRVFVSADGGTSWSEVANAVANGVAVGWDGVAVRSTGDIYVTGGGGYVLRLVPTGGGSYSVTRILENAVTNPDSTNFRALEYTDVEFAPDNDQIGWIIGSQLEPATTPGGTPQFRGVILQTTDGGQTWTRQGVRGAANFGAEFPRLNRIVAFSSTSVWLLGDGGVVLTYQP